jgi:catechol 2,3-dioxygenase-like lactoylglutathione lyase family enzyme
VITGAHFLLYTADADADRAFLRDVLGLRAVHAGGGWLRFGLPPAELGVHPGDGAFAQTHAGHSMLGTLLYLMCDDLPSTIADLESKGVRCSEVEAAPWGRKTTIPLPSGGEIGLYEPRHPTAL